MNVLCCLLVILIHCCSPVIAQGDKDSLLYGIVFVLSRLSSFAVYGFIFLGGLKFALSTAKKPLRYGAYLLGRVKKILIPYLIATAVHMAVLPRLNLYHFSFETLAEDLFWGKTTAHFYFIAIIMQFYLLAPLWQRILRRMDSALNVFSFLAFGFFLGVFVRGSPGDFPYLDRIFPSYLFYWMGGLAAGKHYERILRSVKKNFSLLSVIFAAVSVITIGGGWLQATGRESFHTMAELQVFYLIFAVLYAYALCAKLAQTRFASSPLIRWIDRVSFSVYLWHLLLLNLTDRFLWDIQITALEPWFALRTALTFLLSIGICGAFSYLRQKIQRK